MLHQGRDSDRDSIPPALTNLPFQYFSQTELMVILFPILLSSCFNCAENSAILSQDKSWQLIDEFEESEEGKGNLLAACYWGQSRLGGGGILSMIITL